MALEFDEKDVPQIKPVPEVNTYIDIIVDAMVETAEDWDAENPRGSE